MSRTSLLGFGLGALLCAMSAPGAPARDIVFTAALLTLIFVAFRKESP